MNGFDYAEYLKRHLMVGQIDPWRKTDEGKPLYALLVSTEIAMDECKGWGNQEFTRHDFVNYLKTKDILVLSTPEDLTKLRGSKVEEVKETKTKKAKGKFTKNISEERRETLRNQMALVNERKKASTS